MVHPKAVEGYESVGKKYVKSGDDVYELGSLASIFYAANIIQDPSQFNPKVHTIQEALDKKIATRHIQSLYRVKAEDRREYLDWIGDVIGTNKIGNVVPIHKNRDAAKFERPVVDYRYRTQDDGAEITRESNQIVGTQKVYEIPFNVENFDKLAKDCIDYTNEVIPGEITTMPIQPENTGGILVTQGTGYYVKDVMTNQNYTIPHMLDLRNRTFAELIEYGRTLRWPNLVKNK